MQEKLSAVAAVSPDALSTTAMVKSVARSAETVTVFPEMLTPGTVSLTASLYVREAGGLFSTTIL